MVCNFGKLVTFAGLGTVMSERVKRINFKQGIWVDDTKFHEAIKLMLTDL